MRKYNRVSLKIQVRRWGSQVSAYDGQQIYTPLYESGAILHLCYRDLLLLLDSNRSFGVDVTFAALQSDDDHTELGATTHNRAHPYATRKKNVALNGILPIIS